MTRGLALSAVLPLGTITNRGLLVQQGVAAQELLALQEFVSDFQSTTVPSNSPQKYPADLTSSAYFGA